MLQSPSSSAAAAAAAASPFHKQEKLSGTGYSVIFAFPLYPPGDVQMLRHEQKLDLFCFRVSEEFNENFSSDEEFPGFGRKFRVRGRSRVA